MTPYWLLYRLGFAPWERREVSAPWRRIVEGANALAPGRALDVGCGTGRDAVYLAKRGWEVTGVDGVEQALAKARERAQQEGVEVQWISGDVTELGRLGLEPGYTLLYDFGCIHGLPDPARRGVFAGLSALAAPGATLLLMAFRRGRRFILPRGMDQEEIARLSNDAWELVQAEPSGRAEIADMPPRLRRAGPTMYRLRRKNNRATAGS